MLNPRLAFDLPALDSHLGGGLLPGTLTVIAGATGAGKTQLGLRWANAGLNLEGRRGVVCDLTARGDAQNHKAYAQAQLDWSLTDYPMDAPIDLDALFDLDRPPGDYLHPFARAGRRVTRRDLEPDDWHAWKTDLARTLRTASAFLYAHLIRGTRRLVVDGIEPSDRMSESIQFEFFEYLYHHILRKDDDWAARELLREHFRRLEPKVMAHRYDQQAVGCVYLYTTPHVMLDDLMSGPIGEGDIFANASTIILMGRTRLDGKLGRGLFVAKHRGSYAGDEVLTYGINDRGLVFNPS